MIKKKSGNFEISVEINITTLKKASMSTVNRFHGEIFEFDLCVWPDLVF